MKPPDANQSLLAAAADARYLLGNGYARESVLKLTGNRYRLDAVQRNMLRRGVFGSAEARLRRTRLLGPGDLHGASLALDGHNVLITLENALAGKPLVLADDGCVRDVGQVGRNHRPGALTIEAAQILARALQEIKPGGLLLLLDAPLPKSGELAAGLRELFSRAGLSGEVKPVAVPEKELTVHAGPVASSDSVLLDQVELPVDLAGNIIKQRWPGRRLIRLTS